MSDRRGDIASGAPVIGRIAGAEPDKAATGKAAPGGTPRRRSRRRLLVPLVSLLIIAAIALGFYLPAPRVSVYQVTRHDLIQTIVASGHIETPYRVNVGSQITGIVSEVPVEEGQAVKAGDVLIRLDDHEYASAVVQAKAAVAQAEAKLRQIREVLLPSAEQTLKQAEATVANARASYARAAKLLANGYATQADYDVVRRDRDIAELAMRNAALQVATNRPGGSDYVMAETQLTQARANFDNAQAREDYATITAPTDGRLITRNVERGNVVKPADTLMVLAPTGEIRIDLQIDERDLGMLRVGQKALASADAYPNQIFDAEVAYINPGVDIQQASVLVKLHVLSPPDYLVQDMTVSADIETGRRQAALVLPVIAVHEVKGAAPWVLAAEQGRLVRRQVTIGMQADDLVEITGGLDEGALVVPASDASRGAGDRIRPVVIPSSANYSPGA